MNLLQCEAFHIWEKLLTLQAEPAAITASPAPWKVLIGNPILLRGELASCSNSFVRDCLKEEF